MPENPYKGILNTFRQDTADHAGLPVWVLGNVLSVSPLSIGYDGKPLDRELMLNAQLMRTGERLQAGDQVAMLAAPDGSSFVVLCKVVKG